MSLEPTPLIHLDVGALLTRFFFSLPPNVDFEVDDIEEEWVFDEPFDYIHSRLMTSSIADWKEYLKNCYELSSSSNIAPLPLPAV